MPDKPPVRRNSMFYGALLLTGSSVAIQCLQLIFQVYISSVLGAGGLGRMQLILTVGSFAAILGSGGVRIAVTCLTAEEAGRRSYAGVRTAVRCCFLYGICLSICIAAAMFFIAVPLSERWIGDTEAVLSVRILAFFLPLSCTSSVLAGYYTASGRITELVIVELGERVLSIGMVALLLKAGIVDPCASVFLGTSLASLVSFLFLFIRYNQCMREIPPDPMGPMMKRLLQLTVPLGFNDILRSGLRTAEHMLIPEGLRKHGASGEEAIASYGTIGGMVFPVITFPCVILNSVSDLLVPEMARCRALDRQERIRFLTEKCLRFSTLFAIGTTGICLMLGKELGQLFFDSSEAGAYICIYAPLIPVLYVDAITDGMLKGLSQQLYTVRYNTITSLLDLCLIWALLPKMGLHGFLIAYTVSHVLNFFLSLRRLVLVTGYMPRLWTAVMSGACCGLSMLIMQYLPAGDGRGFLLARGALFLGLYTLFSRLCGTLAVSDIQWVKQLILRKQTDRSD